jgi:hypothetical protein
VGVESHHGTVAELLAYHNVGGRDHAVDTDDRLGHGMALDRETQPLEQLGRALGMAAAVARWIVGRHLDQLGQEVCLRLLLAVEEGMNAFSGIKHREVSLHGESDPRLAGLSAGGRHKVAQKVDQHGNSDPGVLSRDCFSRVMADTALAAHEQHADWA